eukprot:COSAG01_NODE_40129_length_467_cov_1.394022_1_plen_31_part_10
METPGSHSGGHPCAVDLEPLALATRWWWLQH